MKAEITIDRDDVRDALIRVARDMFGPLADEMEFTVESEWRLNAMTVTVKDKSQLAREARAEAERERRAAEREKAMPVPNPESTTLLDMPAEELATPQPF